METILLLFGIVAFVRWLTRSIRREKDAQAIAKAIRKELEDWEKQKYVKKEEES